MEDMEKSLFTQATDKVYIHLFLFQDWQISDKDLILRPEVNTWNTDT